jgi:four helix bundle protein
MQTNQNSIEPRLVDFSVATITLCRTINDIDLRPIKSQLIRSASSVGANYSESQAAISKADFKNKIYIAKKEARETLYWLEVLSRAHTDSQTVSKLQDECIQITRILQSITNKLST